MSKSIFYVRPLDAGKGWAIDEYDGRGAWQHSVLKTPEGAVMDGDERDEDLSDRRRGELGGWNEYDRLRSERDAATLRADAAEKQLKAIAMLVGRSG